MPEENANSSKWVGTSEEVYQQYISKLHSPDTIPKICKTITTKETEESFNELCRAGFSVAKLTFRNLSDIKLNFYFGENILPDIIGMGSDTPLITRHLGVSSRIIVPAVFAKEPARAGSWHYCELLIADFDGAIELKFCANPKSNIQIVIENCFGQQSIAGLTEEQEKRIFTGACLPIPEPEPILLSTPEPKRNPNQFFQPIVAEAQSKIRFNCCPFL